LTAEIVGQPMVPVSLLNQLRRQLVGQLEQIAATPPPRTIDQEALSELTAEVRMKQEREQASPPPPGAAGSDKDASAGDADDRRLHLLCRNLEQVAAAADRGADQLYCDFHDIRQYAEAVQEARQRGVSIFLASVRIQKPGETGLLRVLTRHQPDGFLCRNLAALHYFAEQGFPTVADFSLNAANPLTVDWLRDTQAARVTASYDLNREQLIELVEAVPPRWLEVVIHQHMPMFHMEHCVFCSVLSPGTNKTNCGRPCDDHVVHLRDRIGTEHPLQADVACRNTLYNAVAQSSAEVVPELLQRGVRDFRIELLEQDREATEAIIDTYRQLLRGERSGAEVWQRLQASNRVGVTRGTMDVRSNPLAIL
jgi:putative protease